MSQARVIISLVLLITSFSIGYITAESKYQKILLAQEKAYSDSIQRARDQEQVWRNKTVDVEKNYQEQLHQVQQSNATLDALVVRLRKQLSQTSNRVSTTPLPTNHTHESPRRARVPGEIDKLIVFSDRCAKRSDELILQVQGLQKWINEVYKEPEKNE